MTPTPYRSSYMANKKDKSSMYGSEIVVGRRLGRHLPRIASGDADEDWVAEEPPAPPSPVLERREEESTPTRPSARERRVGAFEQLDASPVRTPRRLSTVSVPASPGGGDEVTGVAGRLRLSRDKAPSVPATPMSANIPKSRWGLWADTQRHLIQAYEYLCHVGEAQQWIEGCLGEELGFGVVEMDEGLRNGVVLAKLVRVFKGEGAVRRIHEVGWERLAAPYMLMESSYRRPSWTSGIRRISTYSATSLVRLGFQKSVAPCAS
jgi:Ras GTPase-activating-like protein IQGAP2/3